MANNSDNVRGAKCRFQYNDDEIENSRYSNKQ